MKSRSRRPKHPEGAINIGSQVRTSRFLIDDQFTTVIPRPFPRIRQDKGELKLYH
jgi:hypothetical protein